MLNVTARTEEEREACPIRNVLARINGKWQILILLALEDGSLRFAAIKRVVGDITQRVLTENLRSLERDGYLTRTVKPGPPVQVSYELTELGRSLLGVLKPLVLWAGDNAPTVVEARSRYDRRQD